jgi:hypothetical protein
LLAAGLLFGALYVVLVFSYFNMSFAIISLPTTDMFLSPQQTRNVLQQVLGSSTLERTKLLLDGFADENPGNDVLLVQDQIGISCVIAMQTWIQKQCFVEWGDALVMDWTHGTNNLGYHLGACYAMTCLPTIACSNTLLH